MRASSAQAHVSPQGQGSHLWCSGTEGVLLLPEQSQQEV